MSLVLVLTILFILAFALLMCSLYFNFKFAKILMNMEDGLEGALDVLDERYRSIAGILEKPVFFDSIEVRQVMSDIKVSRDAILQVANLIGEVEEEEISTWQ